MQVKDLKTKIASVLMLMINLASNQVLATSDCQNGEQNCWECGENCTARFDLSSHTITFSGTGDMTPSLAGNSSTAPWKGIVSQIHSIVIEEGITSVPNQTFHNFQQNTGNVTFVSLPSTLTSIGHAAFARLSNGNLDGLVVPENVTAWGGNVFYNSNGHIYCPASQMNNCRTNNMYNRATFSSYEKNDGFYYIYDSDGNIDEIYSSYGGFNSSVKKPVAERLSQKDENGNIITYDENGRIVARYSSNSGLTRYAYNPDGSVAIYNQNGKLIGLQGKRILTVDEATALVSGKNTFTLKYR